MLIAGLAMDGAVAGGLPGRGGRKASDEVGGDIERKDVAKTVTYVGVLPLAPREACFSCLLR